MIYVLNTDEYDRFTTVQTTIALPAGVPLRRSDTVVPSTAPHPDAAAAFATALINATGEGRPNWPALPSLVEHTF